MVGPPEHPPEKLLPVPRFGEPEKVEKTPDELARKPLDLGQFVGGLPESPHLPVNSQSEPQPDLHEWGKGGWIELQPQLLL